MITLNTKTIVIGSLLAAIAAIFQLIPVFLTEGLVFLTILSAIPIYLISIINPKIGFLSYLITGTLVIIFSIHEGLFFLCTNGVVGMSLGICSHYTKKKLIIWVISSIALTISLNIMNYGIGIPVFGFKIPVGMPIQIVILFVFSLIYNIIYYYIISTLNIIKVKLEH